mgnify:CR=1 FL=1
MKTLVTIIDPAIAAYCVEFRANQLEYAVRHGYWHHVGESLYWPDLAASFSKAAYIAAEARHDSAVLATQKLNDRIYEIQSGIITANTAALADLANAMRGHDRRIDDHLELTKTSHMDIIDRLSELTDRPKPSTRPEWKPAPGRRRDPPEEKERP